MDEDRCNDCGGSYRYDTSIPSVFWNAVIRSAGLPEYLCAACIIRYFAKAGTSFTAELSGDGFHLTPIEVRINGEVAKDAAALCAENTQLRWKLSSATADAQRDLLARVREIVEFLPLPIHEDSTYYRVGYLAAIGNLTLKLDTVFGDPPPSDPPAQEGTT